MLFYVQVNMHVDKRFYNITCFVFMASGLLNAKGKRLISFSNLLNYFYQLVSNLK